MNDWSTSCGKKLVKRALFEHALIYAITGFFFATILSTVIVIAPETPYIGRILLTLSRAGSDLGMGMYADEYGIKLHKSLDDRIEPRFIFVDLVPETCEAYFQSEAKREPQRCRLGHPAQPELLHETLRAIVSGKEQPAVVMVDAALIDRTAAPNWPESGFVPLAGSGAPIIYGLTSRRANDARTVWFEDAKDAVLEKLVPPERSVTALAQTTIEPLDHDEVLRRYAPAILGRPVDQGPHRLIPTVPLAAAVATARGWKGLEDLYGTMRRGEQPGCDLKPEEAVPRRFGFDARLICRDALTRREGDLLPPEILFTIRSSAYRPRTAEDDASRFDWSNPGNKLQSAYIRFRPRLDPTIEASIAGLRPHLSGAVIVVGTSAPSADDVHVTPIGPMAGAEVLLNVTRAYLTFPQLEHPSLGEKLGHKLILAAIVSAVFAVVWVPILWLAHDSIGKPLFQRLGYRLAIAAVFVLGLGLSAVALVLFEVYYAVPKVAAGAMPPDIVTPIVAVSLEGFAEGAKWLLGVLHHWIEYLFRFLRHPYRAVRGVWPFARPGGEAVASGQSKGESESGVPS